MHSRQWKALRVEPSEAIWIDIENREPGNVASRDPYKGPVLRRLDPLCLGFPLNQRLLVV
jgi:hypothetical protein